MTYKNDIREYVNVHPDASGPEVAEACGCSVSTVYRHWADGDSSTDEDAPDLEDDTATINAADLDAAEDEPLDEPDPEDDTPDLDAQDAEDDAPEATFEDEPPKDYRCGDCGHAIEYLDRKCGGCGEQLMWSAIEEAAE